MNPSWRKPAGAFLIIALIGAWAVIVTSLSAYVGGWPIAAQTIFYLVAGVVWILPLGPLLKWIETGRWR